MEIRGGSFKMPSACMVLILAIVAKAALGCQNSPVGIADSSIIPDNRFTASSYYSTDYKPQNARLNAASGWAPTTNDDDNDYLQIDLGQVYAICAVATRGYGALLYKEWTELYKISTSVDNIVWNMYKSGNGVKLFPGNTDSNTVVKNVLEYPILLRYIRFIPTTYHNFKAFRVEAYGSSKGLLCSSLPVGLGTAKIPDSDMTASTSYNSTTSPSKARLKYTAGSSWCAATSDTSPYLQINLGSPYIICGITTQGDHMTDQWVQSYNMLTSNDGSTFTKYLAKGQARIFNGNSNHDTAVKNLLYDGTVGQYIRVAPRSHYGSTNCMRTELYGIKHGGCTKMHIGLSIPSIIPDHRFTATSSYSASYLPSNARLNAGSKAWAPSRNVNGENLQIDLGSVVFLCAVATQGAGTLADAWTSTYEIEVSLDNKNWNYYMENNNAKKFKGNRNRDGVSTTSLPYPIKARFVRFYPVTFYNRPSLRVEVYGISSACSFPAGVEMPSIIQNNQMTSSSNLDNTHTASHGRLYGSTAWCSRTSSNTEYIQIDLGQVMTVTGIATQGDHTMNKWVSAYTISYSMNGNLWNNYKAGGNSDKIFLGNSDKASVRVQWLSHPVTARHVRVTPQAWNTAICMRIEIQGCEYATRPVISGLTNQNLAAAANSYVDLVCIVQEPLIQYIKWYTGNTDITSQSTGLVRGANGVIQSTLRVNYTSGADILSSYNCSRFGSVLCYKSFVCRAMYGNTRSDADGIKSVWVRVRFDYPSTLPQPTVRNINSTAVEVEWENLPLRGFQKPPTSYVLVFQNETYRSTITLPASVSHVITGLEIYSSYNITIKAVSVAGDGPWSQPVNFRTDSIIPTGFPLSITAEAPAYQSIQVTWQAPTSGINGPFLGYNVICISGSDRRESTATPQQTSHTFSGLRKWTEYNCTVVIRNDKGNGPINAYVTTRTLEDAPEKPQSFKAVVIHSSGVRLSWALPSETNGIIRGFKVRYEKNGKSSEKDLPGNTTSSYVLTGLDKNTLYSIKMLAYTIKEGHLTSAILITTAVNESQCITEDQYSQKKTCTNSLIFLVSVGFNGAFLVLIVVLIVCITMKCMRKQSENRPKNEESRKTIDSGHHFSNITPMNPDGAEVPMVVLPSRESVFNAYERIDSFGGLDAPQMPPVVARHHESAYDSIGTARVGRAYDTISSSDSASAKPKPKTKPKPKPGPQKRVYDNVEPDEQANNHQENYPLPIAESIKCQPKMRQNPVYHSLHTYINNQGKWEVR